MTRKWPKDLNRPSPVFAAAPVWLMLQKSKQTPPIVSAFLTRLHFKVPGLLSQFSSPNVHLYLFQPPPYPSPPLLPPLPPFIFCLRHYPTLAPTLLLFQTHCSQTLLSPPINPFLPSSVPHNSIPTGSYIFLHLDTACVT